MPVVKVKETRSIPGYPLAKLFRRDILRGYLQNSPFVFMDLAGKRIFWGIYPLPYSKQLGDMITDRYLSLPKPNVAAGYDFNSANCFLTSSAWL